MPIESAFLLVKGNFFDIRASFSDIREKVFILVLYSAILIMIIQNVIFIVTSD